MVEFVVTNHYLALLSSLTIVPQVVVESRSFLQLKEDGYKLTTAMPMIHAYLKVYVNFIENRYTKQEVEHLEEERMFFVALKRDEPTVNEQLTGKQIVVAFSWQVKPASKIMARDYGRNAHVLKKELLREALWYMLNVPNSDVALGKLAQLVASGMESNWLAKEMSWRMEYEGRTLAAIVMGRKRTTEIQGQAATLCSRLLKDDSLILESFCILTLGLGLSTAFFILNVGFCVAKNSKTHLVRLFNYLYVFIAKRKGANQEK